MDSLDTCEADLAPLELAPGRWIGAGHPTFIVAEVGQNHQGSEDVARSLILAAKEAGADCVKFQKSSLPHKFTRSALERPYSGPHSWGETYGQHKAFLEFTKEQYSRLKSYAEGLGLCFTASAMDIESAGDLYY
jgi:sialic acid synthase